MIFDKQPRKRQPLSDLRPPDAAQEPVDPELVEELCPPVVKSDVKQPAFNEKSEIIFEGPRLPSGIAIRSDRQTTARKGKTLVFGCFDKQLIRSLKQENQLVFLALSEKEAELLHSVGLCDTIVIANGLQLPPSVTKETVGGVVLGSYGDDVASADSRRKLIEHLI